MTEDDTLESVLEESIELSVDELGLNEEYDVAPPMGELVRHANDLSQAVDSRAGVGCIQRRLLEHKNKFARTLGAIALRFASHLGEELVDPLLPLLDDNHPWARYHAIWALIRSRSVREDLLSALREVGDARVSDSRSEGDTKSKQLAVAYLAEVELRRAEPIRLAFEEHLELSVGLRVRRPIGWAPCEPKPRAAPWKLGFVLSYPSDLIQLRYAENPPQVTNMLTVATGLEDTVSEIALANCPEEWVYEAPVVEELGERGGWSAVFTSHEVETMPYNHSFRCFLTQGDTLVVWSAMLPRVDLPFWKAPLEGVAKSISG